MKILAVNGSPRHDGNTANMLKTALTVGARAGYETELYQAGGRAVQGCRACGACAKNPGHCAVADWVQEVYTKMKSAAAILLGSPTYFADLTPEIKAVIDRCGYLARGDGHSLSRKIGAGVCAVRRAGSIHVLDSIQHFFLINDMIVPGSSYWNMSLSRGLGEYAKDEEGVATMTRLGENIVWLLQKLYQ
ncbi:multimeric flavodoxin WrbA [Candidatus Termititenax persephonae]|uniref:Multimeric flavodoxin WrbA n=1 Tax=Candidatus Termititenax persephonae TaxID=2218525 RepID=A0A388TK98_9BACT|nr:multimeric flavodoxin WrbA [Candidatus Termititenax persephonae]